MTSRPPPDPTSLPPSIDEALSTCLYCPSLCRQACPVATAEATDTTSPWALMSLAAHVRRGHLPASPDLFDTLSACSACRACTDACLHAVPVAEALVAVRAELLTRTPSLAPPLPAPPSSPDALFDELQARSRFEPHPQISVHAGIPLTTSTQAEDAATSLRAFFTACDLLDLDGVACGDLARLDLGYDLWFTGRHDAFRAQAARVAAAATGARELVVLSGEALHLLREVYPLFDAPISAPILHISELFAPILPGAVLARLPGRVGYYDSCQLARSQNLRDLPRQLLTRVLEGALLELPPRTEVTGCCGGTGIACARPATADTMADLALDAICELSWDRLVSFSLECVNSFRRARTRRIDRNLPPGPTITFAGDLITESLLAATDAI